MAGIVRGFSGFGAGLVMAPSLSLLLGPTVAVPVIVLLDAVAGAQLIPPAIRNVRWRTVGPLGLAACVGVPLGSLGLARLDPTIVEKSISGV
ncbi:MAG: TSUP family transporter, partial [Actinobacteria bacterium]|nr:TSUP family transporter [Actinomycetota bacterium]